MADVFDELLESIKNIRYMVEDEEPTIDDIESFKDQIDEDMLSEFVDALLIKMGELEVNGKLNFEKPSDFRAATIAVIKKLSQKTSIVSRMTSKFSRFGSKRFLRKAKSEISKAMS